MNKEDFIKAQNSIENLSAREANIKFMSKLISSQSDLSRAYNLQKKESLQAKYKETKLRLLILPRINKSVG
jgi:hypothetical protein